MSPAPSDYPQLPPSLPESARGTWASVTEMLARWGIHPAQCNLYDWPHALAFLQRMDVLLEFFDESQRHRIERYSATLENGGKIEKADEPYLFGVLTQALGEILFRGDSGPSPKGAP